MIDLHHVHLFSHDLDKAVDWYRRALGAVVCFDGDFGGARNVFMRIGSGRLHLYSQAPKDEGRGAVHHLGIHVSDLYELYERLKAMGTPLRGGVREFGSWRYLMCPGPDNVLLELFQIDLDGMSAELADYFADVATTDGRKRT